MISVIEAHNIRKEPAAIVLNIFIASKIASSLVLSLKASNKSFVFIVPISLIFPRIVSITNDPNLLITNPMKYIIITTSTLNSTDFKKLVVLLKVTINTNPGNK